MNYYCLNKKKYKYQVCRDLICALFVTAWNPDFTLCTEHLLPHVSHCKKNRRFSLCNMVSGDRQV